MIENYFAERMLLKLITVLRKHAYIKLHNFFVLLKVANNKRLIDDNSLCFPAALDAPGQIQLDIKLQLI